MCVCAGKGLVRVMYDDDPTPMDTFDVAICQCRNGQWFRQLGESGRSTFVLGWLGLEGERHRVALIEEFSTGPGELAAWKVEAPRRSELADVIAAGKTQTQRFR